METETNSAVVIDDGGRSAAGYKGSARDCVARSISIVTNTPYAQVYQSLSELNEEYLLRRRRAWLKSQAMFCRRRGRVAEAEQLERRARNVRPCHINRRKVSARNGSYDQVARDEYMASLGLVYEAMPRGTKFDAAAICPAGRCVVVLKGHFAAVVDGVVRDTYDSRKHRDGVRNVLGVWRLPM